VLGLVGMSTSSIFKNNSRLVKGIIVGFGIVSFLSLLFSGAVCNISDMVQKRFVQHL
jgi:hypothetical protein